MYKVFVFLSQECDKVQERIKVQREISDLLKETSYADQITFIFLEATMLGRDAEKTQIVVLGIHLAPIRQLLKELEYDIVCVNVSDWKSASANAFYPA